MATLNGVITLIEHCQPKYILLENVAAAGDEPDDEHAKFSPKSTCLQTHCSSDLNPHPP